MDRLHGVSRTVAVVVVAAVVLVAAGAGVAFVLTGDDGGDGPPEAELRVDVTAESVAVVHESGEEVDPDEIQVTVLAGGERTELGLSEFDDQPDSAEQFLPGERFTQTGDTYTGNVTVFVLHEPTDTRLVDETVTVDGDGDGDTGGSSDGFAGVGIRSILSGDGGDLFVGDSVTVEFSLTAGNGPAESTVTVTLDGETVFDETVTAEAGSTVTETVTAGGDLGDGLDITVETDRRSATERLAGPSFGIEPGTEPTASPADVEYVVENTGDIGDERSVTLTATAPNGSVLAATNRSERLAGGETVTDTIDGVTLAPGGELTLSTGSDTATVTLGESEFRILDLDVPDTVTPGESFTGEYVIENVGSFADTQTVTAGLDGFTQTRFNISLDPGERTSDELSFDPGLNATSGVTAEVSTADDTVETDLNVTTPAEGVFTVSIDETNAPVAPGGELLVTSTVENVGEAAETTQLSLVGSAFPTNSSPVTLESGESTQVTLSTTLAAAVTGAYEATVETADDEATVELEVPGGSGPTARFDVEAVDVPETVDAGSALTVAYEVLNAGEAAGTQDITLLVDGTAVASADAVSLEPGDSASDTFSYDTTGGDAGGSLTLEVATENDSASAVVEVLEAPDPPDPGGDLVASLSSEQATVGETVSVDLNVVSVDGSGDEFGSYTFVFSYDDSVLEFQGLTPGTVGSPAAVNSEGNVVAVSAFNPSGATPAEPALSFEFEVVASGTATVQFDDTAVPGENGINNPMGVAYDTVFEDGIVEAT